MAKKLFGYELKKPSKRAVYRFLLNSLVIVVGNLITAAGAALFIVPNGFVMGGTTGLGIFFRNLFENYTEIGKDVTDWIVTITVYAVNILLFIIGAFLLGKKFAVTTLAGTLLYPTFISVFTLAHNAYYERFGAAIGMGEGGSPLLAAIFGALLFGFGIAIVIRVGSSTGGTDIPALILHKFFGTPVSAALWVIDFAIILLQFAANVSVEYVLYGVVINILSSMTIDKVSPIGMRRTQVKIVSRKYKEIRDVILTKISRGVTVLYGQTGYLKEECFMLLTVISSRQLAPLKAEVQAIDPDAFMTISIVSEVSGRGFYSDGIDFLIPEERKNLRVVPPEELDKESAAPAPSAEEPHGED